MSYLNLYYQRKVFEASQREKFFEAELLKLWPYDSFLESEILSKIELSQKKEN